MGSRRPHLHYLSSFPAWPAPPSVDHNEGSNAEDHDAKVDHVPKDVPKVQDVPKLRARKVHAPRALAILPLQTDSHHLRSPSSCPAWPAPPSVGDHGGDHDAKVDHVPKDVPKVQDATKVQARKDGARTLLTDSYHLRSPSRCPAWPAPLSGGDHGGDHDAK